MHRPGTMDVTTGMESESLLRIATVACWCREDGCDVQSGVAATRRRVDGHRAGQRRCEPLRLVGAPRFPDRVRWTVSTVRLRADRARAADGLRPRRVSSGRTLEGT